MNPIKLPGGGRTYRIFDRALDGFYVDFVRLCGQRKWEGRVDIETGEGDSMVLSLTAKDSQGWVVYEEAYNLTGLAAFTAHKVLTMHRILTRSLPSFALVLAP